MFAFSDLFSGPFKLTSHVVNFLHHSTFIKIVFLLCVPRYKGFDQTYSMSYQYRLFGNPNQKPGSLKYYFNTFLRPSVEFDYENDVRNHQIPRWWEGNDQIYPPSFQYWRFHIPVESYWHSNDINIYSAQWLNNKRWGRPHSPTQWEKCNFTLHWTYKSHVNLLDWKFKLNVIIILLCMNRLNRWTSRLW